MLKTILGALGLIAIGAICLFVVCACVVNEMIDNKREWKNMDKILNETTTFCESCPKRECCIEEECVIFRIEKIVEEITKHE